MKKKPFVILILFLAATVLLSAGLILFGSTVLSRSYSLGFRTMSAEDVTWESENGCAEVRGLRNEGDAIAYGVVPVRAGEDHIRIYEKDDDGFTLFDFNVRVSPWGTIYILDYLFDFQHSAVVNSIILLDMVVVMVFMLVTFFSLRRRAEFGYGMVLTGGFGLYLLIILLFVTVTSAVECAESWQTLPIFQPFSYFVNTMFDMLPNFLFLTAPFMLVFALLLALSNLSLIRHEGFRPVNALGIALGAAWFVGLLIVSYFYLNQSGSSLHGQIFEIIINSLSAVIAYFVCMLASTVVCAFLAVRHKPPFDRSYIAILGCAIRRDGSLTPLLQSRADTALAFEKEQFDATGRHAVFVPSGGQGSDETISESEAIKRYLLTKGVPEERILKEDRSVNTYQNLLFTKQVIEAQTKDYRAAFATTNYHIFRGYALSKKVGLKNAEGISAKTKWYFYPNAFIRELAGLIVEEKSKHIVLLGLLIIIVIIVSMLTFGG